MKTHAVRIYGKKDLRLESFELPSIRDDEILARVICDSLCMSSYKAAEQGNEHKRIPENIAFHPTMIGHEFSGEILKAGKKWKSRFREGMKFSIQPAINYEGSPAGILGAPGYSYEYIGGDATYINIPNEVMEKNCLLPFTGKGYYPAALAEPLSCVIGAMHAAYHIVPGSYKHHMGILDRGRMAILAGAGPMGLAAINYVLHRKGTKPGLLVVTDIDQSRLDRAEILYSKTKAGKTGIDLHYINTCNVRNPAEKLLHLTHGQGFNDVFVFAPIAQVIELGDSILAFDGCLNFFAGPPDPNFSAKFNFYNVHYGYTHIVGTSGGNNDDMQEAIDLMSEGLDPAGLVTHIGGLDAVVPSTLDLPRIPGGKKLIYTHLSLPLTALTDFRKDPSDRLLMSLADIIDDNNGVWCIEAEEYLIKNGKAISV
jgi:threonine dehydrogenase-like Zn-dependent dehydrogenase